MPLKARAKCLAGALGRLSAVHCFVRRRSVRDWLEKIPGTQVPALRRRFGRMLPYAAGERGDGPGETDAVVMWDNATGVAPAGPANAKIVVAVGGLRAQAEEAGA